MSVEELRMIERMIIALGGILSITLGYLLFRIASIKTDSGAAFKSDLFTMSLTKVGPGVFFALFGAYVLATGLKASVETEQNTGNTQLVSPDPPDIGTELSQLEETVDKLPVSPEKTAMKSLLSQIRTKSAGDYRHFFGLTVPNPLLPVTPYAPDTKS
jgi:hypothetical protein